MQTGTETADGGDDLRSAIAGAFETDTTETEAPQVEAQVTEESPEEVKEDKSRDEKGRFAKKAETSEEVVEPSPETELTAEKPATEQKLQAPAHWGGASKVRWDKLPARVQEAILKDQEELATHRQKYGALEQVLAPARQQLSMRYGDEVQGIKTLLAYADAMERDPLGTLEYIARERGIDLSQFAPQAQPGQHTDADPRLMAAHQQIQRLEQHINSIEQRVQGSSTSALQSQIDTFAQDPKHPYFNDVRVQMGALIHAAQVQGKNLTLDQAYDMAVNADPVIRAEMQEIQREKEQAERSRKVQEAKAAQTIKGAPGTGGTVTGAQPATLRGFIENAWTAHT